MIHDPILLDKLQSLEFGPWAGVAYRHMFGTNDPLSENSRGARWNPPEVPAIYASLERDTAMAEAEYQISQQPIRPRIKRIMYTVNVSLGSVLHLVSPESMATLGVPGENIARIDWTFCQPVGGAVEWLGHDGLMVSSARAEGINLVIYPNQFRQESLLDVIGSEDISD